MSIDHIFIGALLLLPGTLLAVVYTLPSSVYEYPSNLHIAIKLAFIINVLVTLTSTISLVVIKLT